VPNYCSRNIVHTLQVVNCAIRTLFFSYIIHFADGYIHMHMNLYQLLFIFKYNFKALESRVVLNYLYSFKNLCLEKQARIIT